MITSNTDTVINSALHAAKKISWGEIIYDTILILYAEFFLYSMVAGGGRLVDIFSVEALFTIGAAIDFFVIWYLGMLLLSYRRGGRGTLSMVLFFIACAVIVVALHLGMAFNIFDFWGGQNIFILAAFAFFMLMMGIGGGAVFAFTEAKHVQGEPVAAERLGAFKKLAPIGMWALNIYITYEILLALDALSFMLGLALWTALTAAEFFVFWFAERAVRRRARPPKPDSIAERVFRKYILPLIMITILCFWYEIFLWGRLEPALKAHEKVSTVWMIVYLFFSGIIPIRMLMALEPPVSALTITTGVASVGYLIFSVVRLMSSLFG